jgi:hypothetical protein
MKGHGFKRYDIWQNKTLEPSAEMGKKTAIVFAKGFVIL